LQSVSFEHPALCGAGARSPSGSTQMQESFAHWVAVVGWCCMPRETSPLLEHSCRHSAAVIVAHPVAATSTTNKRNAFNEAVRKFIGRNSNTARLDVASESRLPSAARSANFKNIHTYHKDSTDKFNVKSPIP
jgi:hypothetical protein